MELVLAFALLTAPPGTPESPPGNDEWPNIQNAIHQVAIGMEILDPRETRYVLHRIEDFNTDLEVLRRRYVDLKDAPLVADADRFPDRKTVNELVRFNRAYRKNLDIMYTWNTDRQDRIKKALRETDALYVIWDNVRDARCEFYYIVVRRQALQRLKGLLGDEAYANTELPDYVPSWYFQEIK